MSEPNGNNTKGSRNTSFARGDSGLTRFKMVNVICIMIKTTLIKRHTCILQGFNLERCNFFQVQIIVIDRTDWILN